MHAQSTAITPNPKPIGTARALALLAAARAAGHVNADDSFAPGLRARLDALGARTLTGLTSAQADDLTVYFAAR